MKNCLILNRTKKGKPTYSQNLKGKVSELIKHKIEKLTAKSLDFFTSNFS